MDYSKWIEQETSFVDVRKFMYMSFLRDELKREDLKDVYAGRFANGGEEVVLIGVTEMVRDEETYVDVYMHVASAYDETGHHDLFGLDNMRQEWTYVKGFEIE